MKMFLPIYTVHETGLMVVGQLEIPFVKGGFDGVSAKQDGVITTDLLPGIINYLESVNRGELENMHTTKAIQHLENALRELEARKQERNSRGVLNTSKP